MSVKMRQRVERMLARRFIMDAKRAGEIKPFGWVWFVYGNDGWDVMSDYTT